MLCEHLAPLEAELARVGIRETYRGQPWSKNCREWIYVPVVLDIEALRKRLSLAACVIMDENLDPRSGLERGLVCETCHDAVMGKLEGAPLFA
jgi:hypothetical protein